MRYFASSDNRAQLILGTYNWITLTVSFEWSVENGIATLSDRALKLYVKDTGDITTLLKPCH